LPFIPLLGVFATTYGHPTGAGEKQNETTAAQLQIFSASGRETNHQNGGMTIWALHIAAIALYVWGAV
jgi:hypothetical protein